MELVDLNRLNIDADPHRVEGDQGNRPDIPASVVGGQASHAPSIHQ